MRKKKNKKLPRTLMTDSHASAAPQMNGRDFASLKTVSAIASPVFAISSCFSTVSNLVPTSSLSTFGWSPLAEPGAAASGAWITVIVVNTIC